MKLKNFANIKDKLLSFATFCDMDGVLKDEINNKVKELKANNNTLFKNITKGDKTNEEWFALLELIKEQKNPCKLIGCPMEATLLSAYEEYGYDKSYFKEAIKYVLPVEVSYLHGEEDNEIELAKRYVEEECMAIKKIFKQINDDYNVTYNCFMLASILNTFDFSKEDFISTVKMRVNTKIDDSLLNKIWQQAINAPIGLCCAFHCGMLIDTNEFKA